MNGRERVLAAIEFRNPDRIPLDVWILPAAREEYGERLEQVLKQRERDIVSVAGPLDMGADERYYEIGSFVDPWGSGWRNIQKGIIGEVKTPVFEEYDEIDSYRPPIEQFLQEWEASKEDLEKQIAAHREQGKFILGGWISLFERMQYLRGTENLYCDIALDEEEMYKMISYVMDFERIYVEKWLELDIDAIGFGDDWGSQISLLISPDKWREIFKPLYKELIDTIKSAGKKVFFHSDGYIYDLYPEFIELGVDAVNSQLWCMGVEKIAEKFAGKITFWGEISRQTTLPKGTAEEIAECAEMLKKFLQVNGGGLIGQSELNKDVPLENVEALLNVWD
ncbi:uroporphyrinogen decarboxylase family protein [Faecalicatena orotica]|uniref:uroporphyrinogen decarboxylase family protein n=1 Tax=Faecalicatena orotica TaxID=1544 RepID=UPI003217FF2D